MSTAVSIYRCPVCGQALKQKASVFICGNKHSFDISGRGYVNLLLANQKKSQDPGDGKNMVADRTYFLEQGYYNRLSDELNAFIRHFIQDSQAPSLFNIVDLGCGEGFYSEKLMRYLEKTEASGRFKIVGIDVSKHAIQKAAKRSPSLRFCVGNNYQLPFLDESADLIFSIFSPFSPREVMRVLKPGGKLLVIRPGASHLQELASLLYEHFQLQGDSSALPEQLDWPLFSAHRITYLIHLKENKEIMSLVGMTPYAWNLREEKRALVKRQSALTVTADFQISVFQK